MKSIIVVDLQKDFYDPLGSLYVNGAEMLPTKIARLVPQYDNVYLTMDWHPLNHSSFKRNGGIWPVHCLKYSWGASLPDEVLNSIDINRQHVSYYQKGDRSYEEEYAAFKSITDNQLKNLRDSGRIDICGLCGDYCVGLTIKRLVELGCVMSIGAYFVVRGKKNNDFRPMKWKRRFPPDSGILSDAIGYIDGQLTMGKYPDKIRRVIYWDEENKRKFIFFTNAFG